MTDKEKIEELDAIINLYKDDPNDGLRNKIWVFIETLLKEREKEAVAGHKNICSKCIDTFWKEYLQSNNLEG